MNFLPGMNFLDIALGLIMLLFFLRGFFRGFVQEAAGLIGVLGGLWLAGQFHVRLAAYLPDIISDPIWARIAAFVIIFCATLIGMAILVFILNKLFSLAVANWFNHLFGACAGLAKGVVICAIAIIILQTFLPYAPLVTDSVIRPYIAAISAPIMHLLPDDILRF